MRRPVTMGDFCTALMDIIPWLERQNPNRLFEVRMHDGSVYQFTAAEFLASDDIADFRAGAPCPTNSTEPLTMMEPGADGDVYVRTLMAIDAERGRTRRLAWGIGIGMVAAAGLVLLYGSRQKRRTMGTLQLPQVGPNRCCPSGARATKNNRCHDGRRFVKMVPCTRAMPPPMRVGVPEPFPKARDYAYTSRRPMTAAERRRGQAMPEWRKRTGW